MSNIETIISSAERAVNAASNYCDETVSDAESAAGEISEVSDYLTELADACTDLEEERDNLREQVANNGDAAKLKTQCEELARLVTREREKWNRLETFMETLRVQYAAPGLDSPEPESDTPPTG